MAGLEKKQYTLSQLAEIVAGTVVGDGACLIEGIETLQEARKGDFHDFRCRRLQTGK